MIGQVELFVREIIRENPNAIELRSSTDIEGPQACHVSLYRVWVVDTSDPIWLLVTETDSSLTTIPAKLDMMEQFFPDFIDDFTTKHHRINDSAAETVSN